MGELFKAGGPGGLPGPPGILAAGAAGQRPGRQAADAVLGGQGDRDLGADPGIVADQGDIGERELVEQLLATHKPRAVLNFAAESHVDRSIHGPGDFVQTNIVGTFNLLESVRGYWSALPAEQQAAFRFLHVSTDEVYGTLAANDPRNAGARP